MKKRYLIGGVIAVVLAILFVTTPLWNITKLDSRAFGTYVTMFTKALETGDPAKGMILKWEVNEDITEEDIMESIHSISNE